MKNLKLYFIMWLGLILMGQISMIDLFALHVLMCYWILKKEDKDTYIQIHIIEDDSGNLTGIDREGKPIDAKIGFNGIDYIVT